MPKRLGEKYWKKYLSKLVFCWPTKHEKGVKEKKKGCQGTKVLRSFKIKLKGAK